MFFASTTKSFCRRTLLQFSSTFLFYFFFISFVLTGDESAIHSIDPTVLIENQQKVGIVKKNVKQMAVKFDGGSSKNLTGGIPASTSSGAGESAVVANNSDKNDVVEKSVSLKSETDATSAKDDVVPPAEDA